MFDKACPMSRLDGWSGKGIARRPNARFQRENGTRTALIYDENLLSIERDVIVLMRGPLGLDLAVFETSGRQKSKMVCVETSSRKATTRMRLIRVQNLLQTCFLEHLIDMGCFGPPLPADSSLCYGSRHDVFRTHFLSTHVRAALKDGGVDLAWWNLGLKKVKLRLDSYGAAWSGPLAVWRMV
jgi:hypothetical protein